MLWQRRALLERGENSQNLGLRAHMLVEVFALSDLVVLLVHLVDRYECNRLVCAQIARVEGLVGGVLLGMVSL